MQKASFLRASTVKEQLRCERKKRENRNAGDKLGDYRYVNKQQETERRRTYEYGRHDTGFPAVLVERPSISTQEPSSSTRGPNGVLAL